MMQLYERIGKVEIFIAKAALAILTVFVFISAMARTVHYPVAWAVDAATFLFAWCVFLSGDAAMRKDKLVTTILKVKEQIARGYGDLKAIETKEFI